MKMRCGIVGLAMVAIALASAIVGAGPAEAQGRAVVVSGKVACLNSYSPDGIWVNALRGGSGFARMYTDVADGFGYTHYSFTLPAGGSYFLNVGCGGTPKRWGIAAKSSVVSGVKNNFKCNDVSPALGAAGDLVFGKIFGRWVKALDLTQGVKYKTCKRF